MCTTGGGAVAEAAPPPVEDEEVVDLAAGETGAAGGALALEVYRRLLEPSTRFCALILLEEVEVNEEFNKLVFGSVPLAAKAAL